MPATQRPSTAWYWAAGALALGGVVGAVIWAVAAYLRVLDRVDEFPRTAIPGSATVEVTDPGGLTIYLESEDLPDRAGLPPLDITVLGPDDEPVSTSPYGGDLRLEDRGRGLTAVMTFEAAAAGEYLVTADGVGPADAAISVGPGLALGLVGNVMGVVLLPVVCVLAAVLIVVVVALRRTAQSTPSTSTEPSQPIGTA